MLRRFVAAMVPVIREQWNTGEDFGLRQELLEEVTSELGLASTVEAIFARLDDASETRQRLADAFAVSVDGVALPDLVGGYGVAQAGLAMTRRLGSEAATAVVQGFGSIGGAAARYLARAGMRVVAIADADGLIRNDAGLDVESLLKARDGLGAIDRGALRPGDAKGDRDDWLAVPCDLLVPAAMSYVIDAAGADRVDAKVVVEGANMPTLPTAEQLLAGRGIPVVPDFLANVMTNAWWWWVVFGDIAPTGEAAFDKIGRTMNRLVDTVADDAAEAGTTLREAALVLANRNARAVAERAEIIEP